MIEDNVKKRVYNYITGSLCCIAEIDKTCKSTIILFFFFKADVYRGEMSKERLTQKRPEETLSFNIGLNPRLSTCKIFS